MQKRIVKFFIFNALIACLTTNAHAVAEGFYMGLMTGPATNNGGDILVQTGPRTSDLTLASPHQQQWGTRIYLGNKFSWTAFELGLQYFNGVGYDTKNVPTCSSVQVRIRGFDAVLKAEYSFWKLDVYAKGGAFLLYQTTSGAINTAFGTDEFGNPITCGKSNYTTAIRPTISIGAAYDITQNWVADISVNRIMTNGPIGNNDFYALGISYHFVNIYCGQFLC